MLWTKVDKELCNNTLSAYLGTKCPTSDPEVAVQYLTQALEEFRHCSPYFRHKVNKAPYNPVIAKWLQEEHNAFNEWNMASKTNRPHPLAEARKEANKKLRSAQRQQIAIEREQRS